MLVEDSTEAEDAIGQILGVENVEEATQASQALAEVPDDVNYEEAAEFDIFEFLG